MSEVIEIPVSMLALDFPSLDGRPQPPVRTEKWSRTELHCPSCGQIGVWVEDSPGDWYEGPSHLCVGCSAEFTLPSLVEASGTADLQRLSGIREHIKQTTK